jgi:hypothetical protein
LLELLLNLTMATLILQDQTGNQAQPSIHQIPGINVVEMTVSALMDISAFNICGLTTVNTKLLKDAGIKLSAVETVHGGCSTRELSNGSALMTKPPLLMVLTLHSV